MALSDLEIGDEEVELARWLEESGRRRTGKAWAAKLKQEQDVEATRPQAFVEERRSPRYVTRPSTMSLLVLLAASFLIYFFMDVQLQIALLRRVVVFVFG